MKKSFFIIGACLFMAFHAAAQQKKHNSISLEIGKTGAIFNLAYDRKGETAKVGLRAFGGTNLGSSIHVLQFGGGAYYLAGKRASFLELGTDLAYLKVAVNSDDQFRAGNLVAPAYNTETVFTSFNIGYRHIGRSSIFRIGVAPGFTKQEWLPGGYIGYGFRF